jgi:hydantoinase/carbamoylase family amidase
VSGIVRAVAATGAIFDRLDRLYVIGAGTGANRPGLSEREQEAVELAVGWMQDAGLEVSFDPVGNLYGRLVGTRPELPEVWSGSHLDSVPEGGRLDGALGVAAALEAVTRIAGDGPQERTLAVVSFRDEEGWRFGRGCFGSRALCGMLEDDEGSTRDADGISIREALGALGHEPRPGGWLEVPAAFLEVHIEQGPALARMGAPLGVVTAIAGLSRSVVVFEGSPGHAGTTPMAGRDDALVKAAEYVLAVRDLGGGRDGTVATVGRLIVEPGASNVIPGKATLMVDARSDDRGVLDVLLERLEAAAGSAESFQVLRRTFPSVMADGPRAALKAQLEAHGLPIVDIASGAGHDAGVLATAGVPSAMLFVRSLAGGVSHSPDEHSDDADIALAVDVLEGALRELATA